MRCPFCAEEIQDAAVLCRFCGATRPPGAPWQPPVAPAARPGTGRAAPGVPGMSTMLVSAALLILSALSEVSSLGDPVPLFGAVRGGAVAALYHLIYVGLFAALGFALVKRKSWGYRLVLGATAFYTMDKLIYVLDGKARAAEIDHALHRYDGMLDRWGIDLSSISRVMAAAALLQVLSWWGFAAYCRWRRAFFSEP